jgi:hypothetical protein
VLQNRFMANKPPPPASAGRRGWHATFKGNFGDRMVEASSSPPFPPDHRHRLAGAVLALRLRRFHRLHVLPLRL